MTMADGQCSQTTTIMIGMTAFWRKLMGKIKLLSKTSFHKFPAVYFLFTLKFSMWANNEYS